MVMIPQEIIAASLKKIYERHPDGRLVSIVCHYLRKRSMSERHQFSDSEGPSVR